MRNRLAGYLYRALNKDPMPRLALRIRHATPCAWAIADEVLTLTFETGELIGVIPLSGLRIGDVVTRVVALGCEVAYSTSLSTGAEALIDGQGKQSLNNGDHLFIFDSLLWSLISAYGKQVIDLLQSAREALKQCTMSTAESTWLDLWGNSLGVSRIAGQADHDYLAWIIREVTRPRANRYAIEATIKETTGHDVALTEPWQDMFTLDESGLSGSHHLPNHYYSYFLIHPIAQDIQVAKDWPAVLAVIDRNRPAGVLVHTPSITWQAFSAQSHEGVSVELWRDRLTSQRSWAMAETPLDAMRLDDNEFAFNWPMVALRVRSIENSLALNSESPINNTRRIARTSICLSDGVPLGDENGLLSLLSITTTRSEPSATLSSELSIGNYAETKIASSIDRAILHPVEGIALTLPDSAFDMHRSARLVSQRSWVSSETILGEMRLDDNEFAFNFPMAGIHTSTFENTSCWEGGWSSHTWLTAKITGAIGVVVYAHTRS